MDFKKKDQKTAQSEIEKALKLKNSTKIKTNNLKTRIEFKYEFYGEIGTEKQDKLQKFLNNLNLKHLFTKLKLRKV